MLRNKQKLTSLRWIGRLRLGMWLRKHAELGKSARLKTLQDQSPTDCCGANISLHRFVQFGGCDLGWCRQSVHPSCGATCLFRHAVSDDIDEPLDRRPFGFKGKGFICCQLCRGESVKVGRDGVLGGCIHGDMPENTPLSDVLCLGQKTTWWISPLRSWSIQLTTEAGPAMRSFTWKGDVPVFDKRQSKDRFTRMAEVAVLSCCSASSFGNFTLLKHTKARKKFASTLPTETSPRCASTVTLFNGATGQPLFKRQRGRFNWPSGGVISTTAGWSRRQGRMSWHSNSKDCWKSFSLKVKRQIHWAFRNMSLRVVRSSLESASSSGKVTSISTAAFSTNSWNSITEHWLLPSAKVNLTARRFSVLPSGCCAQGLARLHRTQQVISHSSVSLFTDEMPIDLQVGDHEDCLNLAKLPRHHNANQGAERRGYCITVLPISDRNLGGQSPVSGSSFFFKKAKRKSTLCSWNGICY